MLKTLIDVLAPTTLEDFLQNDWQRRFRSGAVIPERFQQVIEWNTLNRILNEHRLPSPRLSLFRNGTPIDPTVYQHRRRPFMLYGDSLRRELSDGATLVLNGVEESHEPLRQLSMAFSEVLRAPVHVNLYAAWRRERAFKVHFDYQENFILQVYGRKYWKVWKPTQGDPIRGETADSVQRSSSDLVWEGFLEDGAWLYIPRGWWHVAHAVDEPCMHLTVTITPPRACDFLVWITESLGELPGAGRYIPASFAEKPSPDRTCSDLDEDWLARLRVDLNSRLTVDLVRRFISEELRDRVYYPDVRLPDLEPLGLRHGRRSRSSELVARLGFSAG